MPNILLFSRIPGLLDDTATQIVGQAYDAACQGIGNVGRNARMAIADRIIDTALRGKRDPIRLRDIGPLLRRRSSGGGFDVDPYLTMQGVRPGAI